MYGQKQIFQCLAVIILMAVLNFYRSAIRRDKEIQKSLKLKREQQEKPVEQSVDMDTAFLSKQYSTDASNTRPQTEPSEFLDSMHLHRDECNDCIDSCQIKSGVSSMCADRLQDGNNQRIDDNSDNVITSDSAKDINKNKLKSHGGPLDRKARKTKSNRRTISKSQISGSNFETTGVLAYIAVTILLVSLIKAAVDVSKYIRNVRICVRIVLLCPNTIMCACARQL